MGWASGSSLFTEVWGCVRDAIPEDKRVNAAARVLLAFEGKDCDTLGECVCDEWPEIEEALKRIDAGDPAAFGLDEPSSTSTRTDDEKTIFDAEHFIARCPKCHKEFQLDSDAIDNDGCSSDPGHDYVRCPYCNYDYGF